MTSFLISISHLVKQARLKGGRLDRNLEKQVKLLANLSNPNSLGFKKSVAR